MAEVSEKIITYLNSLFGEHSAEKYLEFIKAEPTQYIRVNPLKTSREELTKLLKTNYSIETKEVRSIPSALKIISGNDVVSKTIEHIIGLYYMQGLSSMIPPLVLNPAPHDVVLDLCSAPGSKTTELCELMQNKGTVVANEISLNRVKMLVYNIDRMNITNAGVLHYKGEWLSKIYTGYFDKILVDAPCSGLGIIQKKGEVSDWWSLERAGMLGELQLKLLVGAIKMAKVGGEIVYSTCTLTPEENELVIENILKKYPVEVEEMELPVPSRAGFTSYNGKQLNPSLEKAKRILPWEADSDGFFIIKLKKIDATNSPEQIKAGGRDLKLLPFTNKNVQNHLLNIIDEFGIPAEVLNEYNYLLKGNDIFFVNKYWQDNNPGMFQRIGTKFGSIDRNGKTTLHTQAAQVLEKYISKNIFVIENQSELKNYLDGGNIKRSNNLKGQCAVQYNNHILGTAVITDAGIKSRFPRAKRTQEIIKEF